MDLDSAVRELAPRVLGYCFFRTGDRSLAEDLAQESLTALVQRWRKHGAPESPPAFVFAVARRRAARAILRRRLWLPLELVSGHPASFRDPEADLVLKTERQRILVALFDLPAKDRDVLLLVTVGELPLNDAAMTLGITTSAAKMRALRARRRLRRLLETANGSK